MIPIRTDSPLRRTPWMNLALIFANVLVFALQMSMSQDAIDRYVLDPMNPSIGTFFTYAFLHADRWHLLGNMVFLYIFGNNVNDKIGHAGYLAFYLAGAVAAGIGHMLASDARVLGASGAVSAVTGAYLILFPRTHITILYFWGFIGTFELPSIWFIVISFLKDLLMFSGGGGNVAHMAHMTGTAFGCVICTLLLSVNLLPRDQFDVVAIFKHWNRRRQFRDMVAEGYNPFDYRPGSQPSRVTRTQPVAPDPQLEQTQLLKAQINDKLAVHDVAAAALLYRQLVQIDPRQVLSRQGQLDIANQFAHDQQYRPAVEAYELLLGQYPSFEHVENVQLMTGLIYARYLQQPDRATLHLKNALLRLHDPASIELAKSELSRLGPGASDPAQNGSTQPG